MNMFSESGTMEHEKVTAPFHIEGCRNFKI